MSQPLFQFGDKPPRPIEELTYDEAERVYAMLFPPPEPQQDTAAACKTATERVIRAAVAHVLARKDWDARGGYAPIQRQALHGTMEELVRAVEEMGEKV
jgi:hypothetical protein